jgi:hypothetical protein
MPDTILCPDSEVEALKNLLAQQMILGAATTATSNGAVNNPYLGRFNVIPVKEFTDVDDWYLVDSKMIALRPRAVGLSSRDGPAVARAPRLRRVLGLLQEHGRHQDVLAHLVRVRPRPPARDPPRQGRLIDRAQQES